MKLKRPKPTRERYGWQLAQRLVAPIWELIQNRSHPSATADGTDLGWPARGVV